MSWFSTVETLPLRRRTSTLSDDETDGLTPLAHLIVNRCVKSTFLTLIIILSVCQVDNLENQGTFAGMSTYRVACYRPLREQLRQFERQRRRIRLEVVRPVAP